MNFNGRSCFTSDLDNFNENSFQSPFKNKNLKLSIDKKETIFIRDNVFGNTLDIEFSINIIWLNLIEYSLVFFNKKNNEILKTFSTVKDRFLLFEKLNYAVYLNDFHTKDLKHYSEIFDLENSKNIKVGLQFKLIREPYLLINYAETDNPQYQLKDLENNSYLKNIEGFVDSDNKLHQLLKTIEIDSYTKELANIYNTIDEKDLESYLKNEVFKQYI